MRMISALVAAIFTQVGAHGVCPLYPTMADTGPLFSVTAVNTKGRHANLFTTALGEGYTAWNAIALVMFSRPLLIKQAAGDYGPAQP
jgi:hypothetical protein